MAQPNCRNLGLPLGRRLVTDALYFARPKYNAAGERLMKLADVIDARQQAWPRPSWGAIMTKAFALAASRHPEMRQAFFEFPWGRIGEYESQVACVVVNRQIGAEDAVFLAPLIRPEEQSLLSLDAALRNYREAPIQEVRAFRQTMMIVRLPRLLRRLVLGLILHALPSRRVRHFGTFIVTTLSPFGGKTLTLPTIGSPVMHYGAFTDAGEAPVGLVVDHRVMDGAAVGYTLMEMEQALHHDIRKELLAMNSAVKAAA